MAPHILKTISPKLAAMLLWLASAAVSVWEIYLGGVLAINVYARLGGRSADEAKAVFPWAVFVLALISVAFIVGSGEYHRTRVGTKNSWRVFAWSFAIELLILVLYLVV